MDRNTNGIEYYLGIVESFFSPVAASGKDIFENKYLTALYLKACAEKEEYIQVWQSVLQTVEQNDAVLRVRDMSNDPRHSFKACVTLNSNQSSGLIFFISFVGKLTGVYFSNYLSDHYLNEHPILTENGHFDYRTSYFPLDTLQSNFKADLMEILLQAFPDHHEFDNKLASVKVNNVQVEKGYYEKLDLFQVIFDTNIHGIL